MARRKNSKQTTTPSPPVPGTAVATIPGQTARTTLRGHLKGLPAKAKAAGKKAAAHVSRNRAAYIAGGLGVGGLAAGEAAAGIAARNRQKKQD